MVVSVFNGFEGLVKSMYNVFDPELKVTLVEGKTFVPEPDLHASILAIEGVEAISFVLEENAIRLQLNQNPLDFHEGYLKLLLQYSEQNQGLNA